MKKHKWFPASKKPLVAGEYLVAQPVHDHYEVWVSYFSHTDGWVEAFPDYWMEMPRLDGEWSFLFDKTLLEKGREYLLLEQYHGVVHFRLFYHDGNLSSVKKSAVMYCHAPLLPDFLCNN